MALRYINTPATPPLNIEKALVQLEGILAGISADGIIVAEEVRYLSYWLSLQDDLEAYFPLNLIIEEIYIILDDGIVTGEEARVLNNQIQSWLSLKIDIWPNTRYGFSELSSLLHQIPIDTSISSRELENLSRWAKSALYNDFSAFSNALTNLADVFKDRRLEYAEREQLFKMAEQSVPS